MAVEIALTRGAVALVDAADAEMVMRHKWQAWSARGHCYAITSMPREGRRVTVGMHRLVMGLPPTAVTVDHIDGDGLNNCRSNLRLVSRGQNRSNSIKSREASCKFKGVCRFNMKWRAQINAAALPKQPWLIGDFDTAVDAARAYDAVARVVFGEHARVNFPRLGEQGAVPPDLPPTATTPSPEAA